MINSASHLSASAPSTYPLTAQVERLSIDAQRWLDETRETSGPITFLTTRIAMVKLPWSTATDKLAIALQGHRMPILNGSSIHCDFGKEKADVNDFIKDADGSVGIFFYVLATTPAGPRIFHRRIEELSGNVTTADMGMALAQAEQLGGPPPDPA